MLFRKQAVLSRTQIEAFPVAGRHHSGKHNTRCRNMQLIMQFNTAQEIPIQVQWLLQHYGFPFGWCWYEWLRFLIPPISHKNAHASIYSLVWCVCFAIRFLQQWGTEKNKQGFCWWPNYCFVICYCRQCLGVGADWCNKIYLCGWLNIMYIQCQRYIYRCPGSSRRHQHDIHDVTWQDVCFKGWSIKTMVIVSVF